MLRNIKNICTCPKCGHSVGWRRKLFTGILAQWPCKNCGTALEFGLNRYPILLPVVIIPINLWVTPHVDFWVSAVINGLGIFFVSFISLVVVEKYEPPHRHDAK